VRKVVRLTLVVMLLVLLMKWRANDYETTKVQTHLPCDR
jgi:hypothetical protein